jgi:hypothetical protein
MMIVMIPMMMKPTVMMLRMLVVMVNVINRINMMVMF